ncbi:hypothetical protein [Halorussus litoreus]|uniref:hypothetical protein n=1 Tax=Halorussus litoreus TaxID=1710536 RepID=UPI000E2624EC|nr:hypothetical protein [Halorussus litoreus]
MTPRTGQGVVSIASTHPTFARLSDATGLDVVDPIETRHFSLHTDRPVDPTNADTERFAFPVETACEIRCSRLRIPHMIPMEVRTPDGDHRVAVDLPTDRSFPADDYLLELHSHIKVYLRFEGSMAVDVTSEGVEIAFGEETRVEVGARSYHNAPAATITVPDDPEAVMKAVSAFPSALKTTSPEVAWPTLRGHPPRVERGDELNIPDGLGAPETGVTIRIPPEYGHVYAVAPLAYYLGADVVPGERARLTTESGVDRALGENVAAVSESVESLLKRVFLLDCVVRTEGLYPDDLHERTVLESRLDSGADLDFAALYEQSPADRLASYLAVPDHAVEAIESPWHRVAHVRPDPEAVELLPYVVNDLSVVHVEAGEGEPWTPTESQRQTEEALDSFVRNGAAREGDLLRSAGTRDQFRRSNGPGATSDGKTDMDGESGGTAEIDADAETDADADGAKQRSARGVPEVGEYIPLPEVDALEQAWVGDRTPVQGTKLVREAFEHERSTSEDGAVEITVVCNDEEMREEFDSAAEIYAARDDLRTNVTCKFGVETDDLRDLLARDSDMFHFVGHIDGLGFQCPDGILDAGTLDSTGAKTVLLNGCRSHDQGLELVKAGTRAAIVSLADLWNSGAVEVGETLAWLFYHGFNIGHVMRIVRDRTSLGGDYVVLGDPGVTIAQCANGVPTIYEVSDIRSDSGEVVVEPHAYPARGYNAGSIYRPHLEEYEYFYVATGTGYEKKSTFDLLQQTLDSSEPILVDGQLTRAGTLLDF